MCLEKCSSTLNIYNTINCYLGVSYYRLLKISDFIILKHQTKCPMLSEQKVREFYGAVSSDDIDSFENYNYESVNETLFELYSKGIFI